MTGKIREIVAYAAERHILIVPEIEIPGHSREVVMCYPLFCYEEKRLLPIEKVYSFDPCEGLPEECRRFVIGSQTLNWTESTWCEKDLEYKMWPRTCASAEVLWSGPGKRTFSDFSRRLKRVTGRRAGVR